MEDTKIIFFDGVCNLCNSYVTFVINRDKNRRFKFASLQSNFAQIKLSSETRENQFDSIILLDGERKYEKSDAILLIVKELDGFWKISYLVILIPKKIRDFIYVLIAKNRYSLFGKKEYCIMPSPELESRFLQ
jgi:predicted DCC family thiol-disulfide oxidoreductase YuxK